jgi:hypothetical protein
MATTRSFALPGLRSEFPPGYTADRYFDAWHRANGVDVATLDDDERAQYALDKKQYVRGCDGRRRNAKVLERRERATQKWCEAQVRAGRPVWRVEVPEHVFVAAGVPTPRPCAVVHVPRRREHRSAPSSRRR